MEGMFWNAMIPDTGFIEENECSMIVLGAIDKLLKHNCVQCLNGK